MYNLSVITTLGEEIDLTLFPLALGPYRMSYPFTEGEDPDICKRALDRTITLAELERTECLSPLHFYIGCMLREQLAKAEAAGGKSADELVCTDTKLSDQALAIRDLESKLVLEESESRKYRDMVVAAKQRDEFNATLAHILSLSITFGVERGLRMRRTEAEFEEAYQIIQLDKVVRPAVLAFAPAMSSPAGQTFGWTSTLKYSILIGLAHDASPSLA
ncbi:hypothetical protein Tco_0039774 [Tanacetum coccineum]